MTDSPTPSIQLPSGTERERRIGRVNDLVEWAGLQINSEHYRLAADNLEKAARILRGIPQ